MDALSVLCTCNTDSQLLSPHASRRSQRPAQACRPAWPKLEVEKAFHLPREARAVAVPPDFLHSRHEVGVQVFQPHHLFQPKASVSAAQAAGLDTAVRRLADAKAEDRIVHHYRAGLDAPRQAFSASSVPSTHTRAPPKLRAIGSRSHSFLPFKSLHANHRPDP